MDRLPQEICDHIVSYLAPSNLRLKSPYDSKKKKNSNPYSSASSSRTTSASSSTTSLASTLYSEVSTDCTSHSLSPLACISRQWQRSVERLTFRHIKLYSDELHDFRRIFTPARRHVLKSLTLDIVLPSYDDEASTRIETLAERRANDQAYTQAVRVLFRILKTWEVEDPSLVAGSGPRGGRRGLKLSINHPLSRSDRPYSLVDEWDWSEIPGGRASIHEGRYYHHHIDLLEPELLPQLYSISNLVMKQPQGRWGFRMTYPKVPYVLAAKMPNLEVIDIDVNDNERRFPELRWQNRMDLADAIEKLSLPRLRRAEMLFFQMRYRDQRVNPPVLTRDGVDPLSMAVHKLAQNLTDLVVTGAVDSTLLRPVQGFQKDSWSQLRRLEVNFYETTPSGGWYFSGRCPRDAPSKFNLDAWTDQGADNVFRLQEEQFNFSREAGLAGMEPRAVFRGTPQTEHMVPLVDAFAEATSLMPKLKSALLGCTMEPADMGEDDQSYPEWFVLAYMEPSKSAVNNASSASQPRRQLITSLMGWQPTRQLHKKLTEIQSLSRDEVIVEKDMETWLVEQGQLPVA